MFENWPPVSHFSCLFQGIAPSGFASGSFTKATFSFWLAHETNKPAATSSKAAATFRSCLRICASINDNVSRLYLDSTRQGAGDDIADGGSRFNRRNADFSNKGAVANDQHLGMRFHSVAAAEIQNHKIVGLIHGQHLAL